jgi:leucyl aminopeptidase (aminopeptidase T)
MGSVFMQDPRIDQAAHVLVNYSIFDEKIHGTVHMALGFSYPQTGGVNKPAIHWDLVRDLHQDGTIYADGRWIYQNGDFVPEFVAAEDGRH